MVNLPTPDQGQVNFPARNPPFSGAGLTGRMEMRPPPHRQPLHGADLHLASLPRPLQGPAPTARPSRPPLVRAMLMTESEQTGPSRELWRSRWPAPCLQAALLQMAADGACPTLGPLLPAPRAAEPSFVLTPWSAVGGSARPLTRESLVGRGGARGPGGLWQLITVPLPAAPAVSDAVLGVALKLPQEKAGGRGAARALTCQPASQIKSSFKKKYFFLSIQIFLTFQSLLLV